MADTDIQSNATEAADKTAAATRRAAGAAADAAHAGVESERRSFSAAADAAQASAQAGQQAIQRASDQASDFWRASMHPMSQWQGEFGRWIDQMWRQASPARLHNVSPFALAMAPFTGRPLADLHETDKAVELNIELPGLKAEDVRLSLQGDVLTVSGERADEVEKDQGGYRLSERRFGRFERSFVLPQEADRHKIEASFKDGLLKVTIAKSAAGSAAKTIPIKG